MKDDSVWHLTQSTHGTTKNTPQKLLLIGFLKNKPMK